MAQQMKAPVAKLTTWVQSLAQHTLCTEVSALDLSTWVTGELEVQGPILLHNEFEDNPLYGTKSTSPEGNERQDNFLCNDRGLS